VIKIWLHCMRMFNHFVRKQFVVSPEQLVKTGLVIYINMLV
jgi:hypothetical protein